MLIRNALFGIAEGFEVTAGSRLSATWFPAQTRGRAFAFHQTAYTIGPILAPFIAVPIATATGSWRWSFMVIAFFGLPVLAAIDHFVVDRPERDARVSQKELDYIFGHEEATKKKGTVLDPAKAHVADELPPGERITPYREIFLNRSVFLMFCAGFFGLLAAWGLTTWLPTYGVQQLKLPLIVAGSLSSVVYLGSLCGVISGGILSDKLFATKRTPIWLLGGVIMAAAVLWAISFQPGTPIIAAYIAFFIAGFAVSWGPVGQLFAPYLAELLTPGAVGRSLGVVVLGGMVSVVITDFFQYVLLSIATILVSIYAVYYAGWGNIITKVTTVMRESGFNPISNPKFGLTFLVWQVLLWFSLHTCWQTTAMRMFSTTVRSGNISRPSGT